VVAFSEESRRRWEAERDRREIAELEQFAVWLIALLGSRQPHRTGT
jgi:hypothetical protein